MTDSDDQPSPIRGDKIERLRKDQRLTQTDLAVRADISLSTVQRAERGDETVRLRTIRSLADALGVPVAEIYDEAIPGATASLDVTGPIPQWAADLHRKIDYLIDVMEHRR